MDSTACDRGDSQLALSFKSDEADLHAACYVVWIPVCAMAVTLVVVRIGIAELARQNSSHLLLHVTRPQRRTDGDEVVARAARVPRRGRTCNQQRHPGRAAAGGVLRPVLPARRSVLGNWTARA